MKAAFFLLMLNSLLATNYIRSLTDAETIDLKILLDQPTVALLFQADCSACQQQVKDLKCLEDKYRILLFGGFSAEKSLRQEYQKMKVSYPAYYASKDILKKLQISLSLTPQIISFSKESTSIFTGYKECADLRKLINKQQGVMSQ